MPRTMRRRARRCAGGAAAARAAARRRRSRRSIRSSRGTARCTRCNEVDRRQVVQADRAGLRRVHAGSRSARRSRNFFGNIDDLFSAINDLLQGKLDKAGNDSAACCSTSTFGLGGLIDIASDVGIERGNEDFGQTFGVWGIPQGPYLFVPLFGPTTVRDGTGPDRAALSSARSATFPNVPVRNFALRRRRASTCARQALGRRVARRPGGARPLHVHPQRVPAAARATWSTTASRRREPEDEQ